jgi:hypothetical protein
MPIGSRLQVILVVCQSLLGALLAAAPSAAQQQPAARLAVPGIDAACRADADQRARTQMRLKSVEWTDGTAERRAAPQDDVRAVTRVEIAGRARSAGGWVSLTANCTFAKGRATAVSLQVQPAPALDLSGIARLAESLTPPDANAQIVQAAPAGSGSPEAAPAVRVKPSLTEIPFDPLTAAKKQDFLRDHLLGIKLQAPF